MTEQLSTYRGNCHCGANRFEVQLSRFPSFVICDCELCAKKGYVWIYEVGDKLQITRGCTSETLTSYTSDGAEALQHEFCSNCGTGLFGNHISGVQAQKKGINLRALVSGMPSVFLKGKDVVTLDSSGVEETYPGSLSRIETLSQHQRPGGKFQGTAPEAVDEHPKLYIGSCDCRAVQIALRTKPLAEAEIKEDNCSICVRNGFVGVYPHKFQVTILGKENTQEYQFGRKFNGSPFCKTCGVHCFGNLYGPPQAIIDRLPEAKKDFVRNQLEIQPLNIRVFDDIEWSELDINWSNEGTEGYVLSE
ncbi:glutathione-dependent formaldehyde-activating gfa [Colletotrichum karsti]|uniref:Glutathione-dependent formaldehyde-activating gfa n=1 Tax=Colletotrichum karsti TaxID=1095194 RepID=A0A9P6IFI0_9PEZI|nr:glutathione-dependent formaldehyde-activating gfa [Colletotrichum karsti]KAF9881484.1 glutathione-dependent formaldehyde-activating gfa [Colletotrichum karsti]